MENSQVPDSKVSPHENVKVCHTPEHDNPAYGSVSVCFSQTSYSTNVWRMSLGTARDLRNALDDYFGE